MTTTCNCACAGALKTTDSAAYWSYQVEQAKAELEAIPARIERMERLAREASALGGDE